MNVIFLLTVFLVVTKCSAAMNILERSQRWTPKEITRKMKRKEKREKQREENKKAKGYSNMYAKLNVLGLS